MSAQADSQLTLARTMFDNWIDWAIYKAVNFYECLESENTCWGAGRESVWRAMSREFKAHKIFAACGGRLRKTQWFAEMQIPRLRNMLLKHVASLGMTILKKFGVSIQGESKSDRVSS